MLPTFVSTGFELPAAAGDRLSLGSFGAFGNLSAAVAAPGGGGGSSTTTSFMDMLRGVGGLFDGVGNSHQMGRRRCRHFLVL